MFENIFTLEMKIEFFSRAIFGSRFCLVLVLNISASIAMKKVCDWTFDHPDDCEEKNFSG